MIGGSLALVGLVMATSQATVLRYLVPRLGERRAALIAIGFGAIGYTGYGLATTSWMMFAWLATWLFAAIVMPTTNALMSHRVSADMQGELQGALASLYSLSSIVGPPLMTQLFGHFSAADASPRVRARVLRGGRARAGMPGDLLGGYPAATRADDGGRAGSLGWLAAIGSVEHDPDREVVREVLESVRDTGGDEQQISRRDRLSRRPVEERAAAGGDDVDLVALVRALWVVTAWRVELDGERAMLEQLDEALTRRAGQASESIGRM